MASIDEVEGIGPAYKEKLKGAGVDTTDELLEHAADKAGRQSLAEAADISETLLLEWVNHCDLMRIKGVGSEYADLLEAAGVDSVPELAQRRADNLSAKMSEINAEKKLVRSEPSESQVQSWIDEAGTLDKLVTH